MNRKLTIIPLVLVLLSVAFVSIAQASSTDLKNNDKFETYTVEGVFLFSKIAYADHQYIPSMDNVKMLLINYEEEFKTMQIKIGDNTYQLGKDFAYAGNAKYVFHDVTDWLTIKDFLPAYLWPKSGAFHGNMLTVDYTFDFSAYVGGIEGTLNMIAVNGHINSLSGTGDLRNVQVKADMLASTGFPSITIHHQGIAAGWPDIAPIA